MLLPVVFCTAKGVPNGELIINYVISECCVDCDEVAVPGPLLKTGGSSTMLSNRIKKCRTLCKKGDHQVACCCSLSEQVVMASSDPGGKMCEPLR